MAKKIIIFHMLNDYSGSPIMLANVIRGLTGRGFEIDLYTSLERQGPLSNIEGINSHHIFYDLKKSRIRTGFLFFIAQAKYFTVAVSSRRFKDSVIYINTILPFGAALGAVLTQQKIIYHVHEKPLKPNILLRIAWVVFIKCSDYSILVSEYLAKNISGKKGRVEVVYNSLSPDFILKAGNSFREPGKKLNILMVSSLRKYKGLYIFRELATNLPENNFSLVVNSELKDVLRFFSDKPVPRNLAIFSKSSDIHEYYRNADLVLNLTLPEMVIESFGLTILEAMSYGVPVIVPPYGGVTELVDDGVEGFRISPYDLEKLKLAIINLDTDRQLYRKMSDNARKKSEMFNYYGMITRIADIISEI